jgi:hypothetical protein
MLLLMVMVPRSLHQLLWSLPGCWEASSMAVIAIASRGCYIWPQGNPTPLKVQRRNLLS